MTTFGQSTREIERLKVLVKERQSRFICVVGTLLGTLLGYSFALMTFRIGGYF